METILRDFTPWEWDFEIDGLIRGTELPTVFPGVSYKEICFGNEDAIPEELAFDERLSKTITEREILDQTKGAIELKCEMKAKCNALKKQIPLDHHSLYPSNIIHSRQTQDEKAKEYLRQGIFAYKSGYYEVGEKQAKNYYESALKLFQLVQSLSMSHSANAFVIACQWHLEEAQGATSPRGKKTLLTQEYLEYLEDAQLSYAGVLLKAHLIVSSKGKAFGSIQEAHHLINNCLCNINDPGFQANVTSLNERIVLPIKEKGLLKSFKRKSSSELIKYFRKEKKAGRSRSSSLK